MNSIILKENELIAQDIYRLSKSASSHLKEIINIKKGDILKATLLNESLAKCEVISNDHSVELKVIEKIPGKSFPIHLIIGASRPPTMKKILEHATSQGVENFHIVNTQLGEKSYLQSKLYHSDERLRFLELGLAQSNCFFKLPKISLYERIEDIDTALFKQKFILSPYTEQKIINEKININESLAFAIGSERGWTKSELQEFNQLNFKDLSLSPSILRVEIATFSVCGLLNQLM